MVVKKCIYGIVVSSILSCGTKNNAPDKIIINKLDNIQTIAISTKENTDSIRIMANNPNGLDKIYVTRLQNLTVNDSIKGKNIEVLNKTTSTLSGAAQSTASDINALKTSVATLNTSVTKIKSDITKLVADTVAKSKRIVALEKTVKALQDSNRIYKAYLSSGDFKVDSSRNVTIPLLQKIPLIEARLTKLEPK